MKHLSVYLGMYKIPDMLFLTIRRKLRTRCVWVASPASTFSTDASATTADSSSLLFATQKRGNIHANARHPLVLQGNAGGRLHANERIGIINNPKNGRNKRDTTVLRQKQLEGVYPIVVTPFCDHDNVVGDNKQQESIDYDSFQRCIRFFMDSRVCSGVTICGVLGESNRLSDNERFQLIKTAMETIRQHNTICNGAVTNEKDGTFDDDDQFQLIVGTSHTGTASTIQLCQMAQELGAHGVMVAPTKDGGLVGPQPSNHAMRTLFERIAATCGPDLSIVVQDHPSSTGVYMDLDFLVDLVCDIESIRCIKLESLPTMDKLAKLRADQKFQTESVQERCTVLTGLGALYAGFDLEQQMSSGFMTGFAFPEILHAMYLQTCYYGDMEQVHRIYQRYLPLIVFEQQPGNTGLMIRKEILKMRGMIASSHLRHPGGGGAGGKSGLSDSLQRALRAQIARSFPPDRFDITKPIPPALLS